MRTCTWWHAVMLWVLKTVFFGDFAMFRMLGPEERFCIFPLLRHRKMSVYSQPTPVKKHHTPGQISMCCPSKAQEDKLRLAHWRQTLRDSALTQRQTGKTGRNTVKQTSQGKYVKGTLWKQSTKKKKVKHTLHQTDSQPHQITDLITKTNQTQCAHNPFRFLLPKCLLSSFYLSFFRHSFWHRQSAWPDWKRGVARKRKVCVDRVVSRRVHDWTSQSLGTLSRKSEASHTQSAPEGSNAAAPVDASTFHLKTLPLVFVTFRSSAILLNNMLKQYFGKSNQITPEVEKPWQGRCTSVSVTTIAQCVLTRTAPYMGLGPECTLTLLSRAQVILCRNLIQGKHWGNK